MSSSPRFCLLDIDAVVLYIKLLQSLLNDWRRLAPGFGDLKRFGDEWKTGVPLAGKYV